MLKYYKYPLKVWLTTALLGTLAYLLCLFVGVLFEESAQVGNVRNLNSDNYFFMGVIAVIALACSFPCFITLWVVYSRLMARDVSIQKIKIILTAFGAITGSICLLSVYYPLLGGIELNSVLELLLPYNAVLIVSIWCFNLRSKIEVANGI